MRLTCHAARADVAQLVRLLTESHPDPYAGAGGSLAFHRQARDILAVIPDDGISVADLLRLMRPLVAFLRDGHTRIGLDMQGEPEALRLWLEWEVVERELYIAAVYRPEDERLLGARLRALDGICAGELLARMGRIQGYDNEYQNLLHLASALRDPLLLPELLRMDGLPEALPLEVALPEGPARTLDIPLSREAPGVRVTPPSVVTMPDMNAARMGWRFLDERRRVAYLRADSMMHYREAFEFSAAVGSTAHLDLHLDATARMAQRGALPDDLTSRIALVPSATDLLRDLVSAMRDANSPYLLVDLRFCPGGNSFFAFFLEYVLYGVEAALSYDPGYQVKRYSSLYLANRLTTAREEVEPFLLNGGYDFTEEDAWKRVQQSGLTAEERDRRYQEMAGYAAMMPSFGQVFERREDEAIWTPRVIALTSAYTYSAAFDVVVALTQHGAEVVGVPSAQAGNCFIDALWYTLAHSGLRGSISYKRSLTFPTDPERGKVLQPTRELTYAYLAEHRFDPNASVTLALQRLDG